MPDLIPRPTALPSAKPPVSERHEVDMRAHITGFAAMFGFAALMDTDYFAGNRYISLVVLLISIVTVVGVVIVCTVVRGKLMSEGGEDLDEVLDEAEDDVMCLCFSFVLTAVVRTLIKGKRQPYNPEVEPLGVDQSECWTLLCTALCFTLLSLIMMKGVRYCDLQGLAKRCGKVSGTTSGMAGSWCGLFWADWQMYTLGYEDVRVVACLIIALGLTLYSIVKIFLIEYIADHYTEVGKGRRTLRFWIVSLGVLVGFAWEKAFDVAMEDISHSGALLGWRPGFTTDVEAFLLLAIVLPAWYWYILPKALCAQTDEEGKA